MPTFIRHVPRKHLPWDPRGIDRASEKAKARWVADGYAEVLAHYEDHNIITDVSGYVRLASVNEKERLHLLKRHHTLPGFKSGEAKANPKLEYAERASMAGDGFHHGAVAWFFGHLFAYLGYLARARRQWRRSCSDECGPSTLCVALRCRSFLFSEATWSMRSVWCAGTWPALTFVAQTCGCAPETLCVLITSAANPASHTSGDGVLRCRGRGSAAMRTSMSWRASPS